MKVMNKFLKQRVSDLIGYVGILLLSLSCNHEEILLNAPNEHIRSVGGYLGNNYDYTLFTAALEYTGLLDTLTEGIGPFTVLAPGNDAFTASGIRRPADIQSLDRDSLRRVMAYHIIPMRVMEADIPLNDKSVRYSTLLGEELEAYRIDWQANAINPSLLSQYKLVTFAGVEIKKEGGFEMNSPNYADIELSNGVLHTLAKIMQPHFDETVQDLLASRPEYSIFVAGLKRFGLWDELAGEGTFTVFAPTDQTFQSFGITRDSIDRMDPSRFIGPRLFGAYIIYGKRFLISDHYFYYSMQGQSHYMDTLRGDPDYHRFFMGSASYYTEQDGKGNNIQVMMRRSDHTWAYSLGITDEDKPFGYGRLGGGSGTNLSLADREAFLGDNIAYDFSGTLWTMGLPMGLNIHGNDNLCKNGVLHQFNSLAVLPEEAEIQTP